MNTRNVFARTHFLSTCSTPVNQQSRMDIFLKERMNVYNNLGVLKVDAWMTFVLSDKRNCSLVFLIVVKFQSSGHDASGHYNIA